MISPERFAQLVIEALRARGEKLPIHFDAGAFVLRIGENPQAAVAIVNLQNAYNECENASKDRHAEIIKRLASVRGREKAPSDYTIAKARLGLSLCNSAYLDVHRGTCELHDAPVERNSLVHRPITDELVVVLVDDDGNSLQFLDETYLAKWGVTIETAMRDATINLAVKGAVIEQVGSALYCQMGDSYDAARIVLVEMLRDLPIKGKPVALAPDRDCLIFTGSEDMDGLTQMVAMGHVRFDDRTRAIGGRPVVLEGNKWAPFNPPEPVNEKFIQLTQLHDELRYDQQATLLRKLHEKRNDSVRIAEFSRGPTGAWNQFTTLTLWEKGGPALLPQAELVAFMDRVTDTVYLADWNDVVRVVGQHMVRTQDVPPRYRVVSFPTSAELQAMGTKVIRTVDLIPPLRPSPS